MSSQFRYRGGNTSRSFFPYDPSHPIEEGDLLFADPILGHARPASDMVNQGSVALNQLAFAQYFLGVAGEKVGLQSGEVSFRLNANDPKPPCVTVLTDGLFEFDCEAETEDVGEGGLVAIYAASTAAIPNSQKVMAAATDGSLQRSRAIGVLRRQPASFAQTDPDQVRCLIEIKPGYPQGGPSTQGVPPAGTYTNASGQ